MRPLPSWGLGLLASQARMEEASSGYVEDRVGPCCIVLYFAGRNFTNHESWRHLQC